MSLIVQIFKTIYDFIVTIILWIYFTIGTFLFFSPQYLFYIIYYRNIEQTIQVVNNRLFRSFFYLTKILSPGLKIHISDEVKNINSSIVVSNHISYLDPLLMISLYKKCKTIVKGTFFKVPLFGWFLQRAGFLPFSKIGNYDDRYVEQVKGLNTFIGNGGNLFLFPEGTRSKDGKINRFKKGAFSIARRCNSPIEVLLITNSNNLFKPGKFLFNTCVQNTISIEKLGTFYPDYNSDKFSIKELVKEIECLYKKSYSS